MAAIIDADYLRTTFNIHPDVDDERFTPYFAIADRKIRSWVGDDKYEDEDLADEMKYAAGCIVMNLLLLNLNTAVRGEGLVRREVVEGTVTLEYLSPNETSSAARSFLDQATDVAGPHRIGTDMPSPPLPVFED